MGKVIDRINALKIKLPEPKSSLKKATKIKINPYPIAFPIPSSKT